MPRPRTWMDSVVIGSMVEIRGERVLVRRVANHTGPLHTDTTLQNAFF